MNHLHAVRKWSFVLRGAVLALAIFLVACGNDAEQADPTATAGSGQAAVPTAPTDISTPESEVNEDEITVLDADPLATAAASPDSGSESTPDTSAVDLTNDNAESTPEEAVDLVTTTQGDDATSTPADAPGGAATAAAEDDGSSTPVSAPGDTATAGAGEETDAEGTPATMGPERTGNETFTNPGDGTGGSGMPGEPSDADEEAESAIATPVATPVAQLSIEGCEVPDVPNFTGENADFVLTADVNFRSGPGVNCDLALDEPIGEGQTVTVIGGPVRQTEDDTEWVQIEIDGEEGWISTEFVEPEE